METLTAMALAGLFGLALIQQRQINLLKDKITKLMREEIKVKRPAAARTTRDSVVTLVSR